MVSKRPLFYASSIAVVSFGTAIFFLSLFGGLWFLSLAWVVILLTVGAAFVFQMLSMAIKERKVVYSQAIAIVVISGFIALNYTDILSTDVRFFLSRPYYEIQLARVQAGQNVAGTRREGNLVAFYLMSNGPDTWVGFVSDPTESLSLPKSQGIFNGLAYEIRQLNGRWFICYFR